MRLFNLVAILSLLAFTTLGAQDVGFTNAWLELDAQGRDRVMRYAEDFKVFLGKAKSEMQFVREAVRFAESNGFRKWDPKTAAGMKPGSRWYAVNRDRTIVLFVVGTEVRVERNRIRKALRLGRHRRPFAPAGGGTGEQNSCGESDDVSGFHDVFPFRA